MKTHSTNVRATQSVIWVGLFVYFERFASSAYAQANTTSQPGPTSVVNMDYVLQLLNLGLVILGIMVTVLLVLTAFNVINQFREAKTFRDELEKQLSELKTKYNLADMKTPDEILALAASQYMERIKALQAAIGELSSRLEEQKQQNIQLMNEKDSNLKLSLERMRESVSELNERIAKVPNKAAILQEVSDRYQPPSNLRETLLRQVLDAFLRLKDITQEETESISAVLKVNQRGNG